jgi:hypothetical protein
MVAVVNAFNDPCFILFIGHESFGVVYLDIDGILRIEGFVFFGGHSEFLYP